MRKNTQAAARTRQNLMDAFWQLYCEKRIEKITIGEITAKAGYNRGTFYEYFTDVYQVLEQLEDSLVPSLHQLPPITLEQREDGSLPMGSVFDFYEENSRYYSVLLGKNGDPAFAAKLKQSIKPMLLQAMPAELQSKQESGYALEYILSAMIGVMSFWYENGQDISKERLIQIVRAINEKGIGECFSTK